MAVVVTALTLVLVWRLDRVENRASAVNQYYLPVIRSLNVMQGKWQAYQRTFEQNVGFRRWGARTKPTTVSGRSGLAKAFGSDVTDLEKILQAARSNSNVKNKRDVHFAVVDEVATWLRRVDDISKKETEFFVSLAERLKNKDYTGAALLYSNFRASLTSVFTTEWSDLSHRIELVAQENQHLIESELGTSQSIVLFFLIGTLVLSLIVLLKLNRWVVPVSEWTRVAREIVLRGTHSDIKYPPVRGSMPEEMQILTREFTRMATTLGEREKTINEQKKKLEAAVETERKLAHAKKLLLAANMSSQVAHEVRNPLNSMGLQLEMLKEDLESKIGEGDALLKRVDTVTQQIQRLERITDRYLDLGSVRDQARKYESVDLHALIEDCVEFVAQELAARKIRVELKLDAKQSTARGDRDALSQVLFNLLRNAMDALGGDLENLSPSQSDKWIRISTRNVDQSVVVNVEDNGPGVKSGLGAQIFEPFVTTKAQGHGLGLSISRQICLDHGGELDLTVGASRNGASFDMRVPCAY